jgi:NAD-specific glutamate dehydrogenase
MAASPETTAKTKQKTFNKNKVHITLKRNKPFQYKIKQSKNKLKTAQRRVKAFHTALPETYRQGTTATAAVSNHLLVLLVLPCTDHLGRPAVRNGGHGSV